MKGIMLARDLARIIDDAAIFAGKDSTLPMLNAIRLESTAKHLIAVATTKVFGVNPQDLARFGRVHDAHRMTMKFSGPGRPALVTVGGQFVGCIMPVRLDTSEGVAPPDWMAKPELTPEPAKKSARVRKSPKKAVA